jgi:Group II intron, maturase-specific domain
MEDLNPLLRGWANYYRKATNLFENLDRWIRRKLRCLIWRRWARVRTRARQLIKLRFTETKAWCCARSGRGPLVERWVLTHERRVSQLRLRADWSHLHRGNRSSFCLNTITLHQPP